MTITDISHALDMPKSSTFELLYTLVEEGFLEIDNDVLKTFRLGMKAFEVGVAFVARTDLHRAARPLIEELMAKSGETVFLAVEDKGSIVYLDKAESQSSIRTTCVMGSRNMMYRTGMGKALLASYTDDKVREITGGGELQTATPYSICHHNELVRELVEIRKRGYSIDNRENEMEIICVAAPIYDRNNRAVAAISIASPYSKMNENRQKEFSEMVMETALEISHRMGYLGSILYC
jgi:Transcriptional regulator